MIEQDFSIPEEVPKESGSVIPEALKPSAEVLMAYAPQESWFVNPHMAHNGIHDIGHAARTLIWADLLANSWETFLRAEAGVSASELVPVERKVLRVASSVHDLGRRRDIEPVLQTHAHIGAEHFREIWPAIDPDLTEEEVGKIINLIHYHAGETITAQVKDHVKPIANRVLHIVPHEKKIVGIEAPIESGLLNIADAGLEAARVYENKASIPGQIVVATYSALANLLSPGYTPGEYLALRNRFWLRSSADLGYKDSNRPGAVEFLPLARQLYRESITDKAAYAKDPWGTTFATAKRLKIVTK